MPKILSIVGWHNAGKTTLIEHLVRALKDRGTRVGVIKHSRGGFQMDHPGTDTHRFRVAGADLVVIASEKTWAWLERRSEEISLAEILERLPEELDWVIVEGYKGEPLPKIEVMRAETGMEPIAQGEDLIAVVTDDVPDQRPVPHFRWGQVPELVAFLLTRKWKP